MGGETSFGTKTAKRESKVSAASRLSICSANSRIFQPSVLVKSTSCNITYGRDEVSPSPDWRYSASLVSRAPPLEIRQDWPQRGEEKKLTLGNVIQIFFFFTTSDAGGDTLPPRAALPRPPQALSQGLGQKSCRVKDRGKLKNKTVTFQISLHQQHNFPFQTRG